MSMIEDAMLYVAVVQAGSFTQASERLSSSKSQISRRISHLEQRLNAQLLLRRPRGLQLTPAGENFYQECLAISEQFDQSIAKLQQDTDSVSGHINVTATLTLGTVILGPLLAKFLRNYPDISVALDVSDHVRSDNASFDLALRAAKHLPDSDLIAKKVMSYGYKICATPSYLEKHGTPSKPQDLNQHQVITCVTGSAQEHWHFENKGQGIDVAVNSVAKVTHMVVQKDMAKEDLGLIRVPDYWVNEELATQEFVSVLDDYNNASSNLFLLYKATQPQPKRIKVLVDYLMQYLPEALQ